MMVEALKSAGGHVEHDLFVGSKTQEGSQHRRKLPAKISLLCPPLPALAMLYDEHHVIALERR
jgi:hypothetical protein